MRSFPLFLTAAALGLVNAGKSESDIVVTVTATRTHSVCPLTSILTCDAPDATGVRGNGNGGHPGKGNNGAEDAWASLWDAEKTKYTGQWDDWNNVPPTDTETTVSPTWTASTTDDTNPATTTSGSEGSGGHGGLGSSTTSSVHGTSSETSPSSGKPSGSTTASASYGTTSNTGSKTGTGPGTVSTSSLSANKSSSSISGSKTSSTGSSATASASKTTTSGLCPATSTPVSNSTDICNTATDRSKWCDGKDLDTDVYTTNYFTGVTRSYNFTITNTTKIFDGTGPKLALAINDQVPGPVIEANWGDMIEVTVINQMQDNSTSIHFHGIRQFGTNDQDGVPGVTECAIAGNGGSRTYTWHASSYGTSWYHSHSFAQYGDGIRGPIVIHGPATANYDLDMGTVMIDDTFPVSAAAMASRIAHVGPAGSFNTLFNGKNKSPDGSAGQSFEWSVKPCKKHLFRIINSSAQNAYIVGFDKHTMTVIAADFVPIIPYKTTTLNIANGQRYDVIVEMDQAPSRYFVRAVIQTQCPSGGANSGLGIANAIMTYEGANSTATVISQTAITNVTADICQDEPLASLVPHLEKPAGTLTSFQSSASTIPAGSVTSVATNDDGTVFQWYINNAAINVNYSQPTLQTIADGSSNNLISNPVILNKANQWVYFIIQNQFFASHPMHVHGHDFSVLGTGIGNFTSDSVNSLNFNNPMRRDTVMLRGSPGVGQPAGWTVIGFETNNPGAWLMHCHITWHVDGGLALQFVERPDDIDAEAFVGKKSYKEECSALAAYEAANPYGAKLTGQSGLKKRTTYEDLDVRKFQAGAKMHIDKFRKRYASRRHAH
ncbi:uncharacterized protein Z518_11206 [Rhinocladiella mackenziei CBS 650.93]|uniref:laccase n=1 Tax=Rhinocladiella mackenziei CBS 650.93 TaxID=1442369 RepID=A0A0D2GM63_9EURO|nr:uncharacterized protein Z518_11206 [Rhinocladiella mackenziei CBS 650.93]KIW99467.1 hypothetical protein Z518_11206 [Rhinocladiella mackenziei CBS 650.93]